MDQKFVLRLLDDDRRLLAWAEVFAPLRQGGVPAPDVVQFVIEIEGGVRALSIHWTDLDVRRLVELPTVVVHPGQVFDLRLGQPLWTVPSTDLQPLPAVTVRRSIEVVVPSGAMASVGH